MDTLEYPRVTIRDSICLPLESARMERTYELYILLPSDYATSDKTYPVIYALDGQWDFALLAGMYGGMVDAALVPRAIIVAVTWPGGLKSYEALRMADFAMPSKPDQPGGRGDFLRFFQEELVPFVDSHYRTDPSERTFMGGSLAGYFVLYTMLHDPSLFKRYVSVSPALYWEEVALFDEEAAFAGNHDDLRAHLYLAVGEWEDPARFVEPMQRFAVALASRGYPSLQLTTEIIPEELHNSIKPRSYSRGLRAVFARKVAEVSARDLDGCAGVYRAPLDNDELFTFTITREGNRLFGQSMYGETPAEFFPESRVRFFSRRTPIAITFNRDAGGTVASATFHWDDGDSPAERIAD